MSEYALHVGSTKVVVASVFGLHTLGISENGRPVERVGAFDNEVAASRFVEAFKRGLAGEGIDVMEWRPRKLVEGEQPTEAQVLEPDPPLIA